MALTCTYKKIQCIGQAPTVQKLESTDGRDRFHYLPGFLTNVVIGKNR